MCNLKKLFTAHPHRVGETYFGHMRMALTFFWLLLSAALSSLIHAFFPFWLENVVSNRVAKVVALFQQSNRGVAFDDTLASLDDDKHDTQ